MPQALRFLLFFVVVGGVAALLHVYLFRRLVRDAHPSPRLRRWGKGLAFGLFGLLLVSPMLERFWDTALTRGLSALGWTWMGVALVTGTVLVLVDAVKLVAWPLTRKKAAAPAASQGGVAPQAESGPSEAAPASPERRVFLSRAVAGGALAVSGGLSGYGLWRAYAPPSVTELSLVLPRLPKALDGLTVVQVSDIHVSTLIQRRFMDDMVQRCNALKPDLVAVTGDLMDGSISELGGHVAALQNLKTRFGTYFITGNHEYYSGDVEWSEALEGLGVTVLRNRHVKVGDAGASFDLVGVDDWIGNPKRRYDLEKAVAGRDPERAAVLLAHQPRNFEQAVEKGIGLQLSGHTHGGQFFPGTMLIPLMWTQPAGHYTHKEGHLYVSRGTGFWGPPLRIGAEPEIVKLVLRAG